jgi:hypothetical protein
MTIQTQIAFGKVVEVTRRPAGVIDPEPRAVFKNKTIITKPKSHPTNTILKLKINETSYRKKPSSTVLIVRFSCDPLRYSAWIVNEKSGVSGDILLVKYDDQAVLLMAARKQTSNVLILEDARDESEKSFIDHIRNTRSITISYQNGQKQAAHSNFLVSQVSKQLNSAEKSCFN